MMLDAMMNLNLVLMDGLVNTKERVQEAMQSLPHIASEVTVMHLPTDVQERDMISTWCARKCSTQFTTEHVMSVTASCAELSHSELDMAILGQLMASVNTNSVVSTAVRHKENGCKKVYTSFSCQGKPVCI